MVSRNVEIGRNLQRLRIGAGWKSAKAFAESIGMPVSTYTNYEQGVRGIQLDTACELCNALSCSIDELAGRETPRSRIEYAYTALNDDGRERLMEQAMLLRQMYSDDVVFPANGKAV